MPFAEALQRLLKEGLVRRICAHFNNHAWAQAVADAIMLKGQMDLLIPADLPETLLETYSGVKAILGRNNFPKQGGTTCDTASGPRGRPS